MRIKNGEGRGGRQLSNGCPVRELTIYFNEVEKIKKKCLYFIFIICNNKKITKFV